MLFKEALLGKSKTSLQRSVLFLMCSPLGLAWSLLRCSSLAVKCGQKYSECIMGLLYFGGMVHLPAAFGDACRGMAELGSCWF